MANNQTNEEYVKKGYLKAYLANRGIKCVSYDEWERLCECIDDAKSADVRENVKGEWIVGELYNEPCTCSVCKHTFQRKAYFLYSYCPNCGADMRGEV